MTWDEISPTGFGDLTDAISSWANRSGFLFRGEASIDWPRPLSTSLDRACCRKGNDRRLWEAWLIDQFRQEAPAFLPVEEAKSLQGPVLDTLMVMRHYEVPCRVLDWTESAYVAAFNAAGAPRDIDGVVYGFAEADLPPKGASGVLDLAATTVHKWVEHACTDGRGIEVCRAAELIPRMLGQKSVFTVGGPLGVTHRELLSEGLGNKRGLMLRIPAKLKNGLFDWLWNRQHTTALRLFPDVVGLGRGLRQRAESMINVDFDPMLYAFLKERDGRPLGMLDCE